MYSTINILLHLAIYILQVASLAASIPLHEVKAWYALTLVSSPACKIKTDFDAISFASKHCSVIRTPLLSNCDYNASSVPIVWCHILVDWG